MQRCEFLDTPEGDTVVYDEFLDTGYRVYPHLVLKPEERVPHFDRVKNMSIRDDDVVLASYPKVGANWLWEMISMVMDRKSDITSGSKVSGMMESTPVEAIDNLPSPRILGAHLKVNYLPKEVHRKRIKCILLCRNPKDTAVSFYNHTVGMMPYRYNGKFENYVEMFMRGEVDFGSYPEYLLEWQTLMKENPDWHVHVMKYEDLKEDCFEEMKKLCQYLEQDIDDDLLQNIVNKCCFRTMKEEKPTKYHPKMQQFMKMLSKNGFSLFRKGQVGDWKNWFSSTQSKRFDDWWQREARDLDIVQFNNN